MTISILVIFSVSSFANLNLLLSKTNLLTLGFIGSITIMPYCYYMMALSHNRHLSRELQSIPRNIRTNPKVQLERIFHTIREFTLMLLDEDIVDIRFEEEEVRHFTQARAGLEQQSQSVAASPISTLIN